MKKRTRTTINMIRLLIVVLVRFFITVLVISLALAFLKKIIQTLQGHSHPSPRNPQESMHPKTMEDYKDVKDAKFEELPKKQTTDNQDSHI